MNDLKTAALRYAGKGIAVFPCNGKVPLTEHGYQDASTNPVTVAKWWDEHPNANIGLHPGSADLLVIDIDCKGEADGFDAIDILEREHGKLPDTTRIAITPSGGCHYYFRVPADEDFGNRSPIAGIDIRADKGYVIAPPSSIEGKPYRWTNELKAAPLPDAWVELLREKPYEPPQPAGDVRERIKRGHLANYIRAAFKDEGIKLRNAPEGQRNDAINDYGFALGQLVHLGLKADDIELQLEWAASQWGWTRRRRNVRKDYETLRRAIRDGMNSPRKVANHA